MKGNTNIDDNERQVVFVAIFVTASQSLKKQTFLTKVLEFQFFVLFIFWKCSGNPLSQNAFLNVTRQSARASNYWIRKKEGHAVAEQIFTL